MPSTLSTFLASPLAREPRLLLRKVAKRLGRVPAPGPRPPPAGLTLDLPAGWAPALRDWFRACAVSGTPPEPNRVFGRNFPRSQLLAILREGPPRVADLSGDVKLGWDFARSHHMPLHAFLAGPSCVPALAAELRELVTSPATGPFWSCPMDVAIRAVNWLATEALLEGALSRELGREIFAAIVWQHLDVIWRHLEAFKISNNHYLANLLGLVACGRALGGDPLAQRALAFARREWPRALLAHTNTDGGLDEASLPYHAFVTEMALVSCLLDDVRWPDAARNRLALMVQAVADHLDAGGDVFATGDDDSGRVFLLDEHTTCGRGRCVMALARQIPGLFIEPDRSSALHPESGWWTGRRGAWIAHLEFGGVGTFGEGSHAHDDDLSLCVSWRGRPVFVDPGSYLYAPDPAARNRFRSAAAHTAVRLLAAGDDPDSVPAGELFRWPGRASALPCRVEESGACVSLAGPRGTIRRAVRFTADGIEVSDAFEPQAGAVAWWHFHLHPEARAIRGEEGWRITWTDGTSLALTSEPAIPLDAAPAAWSRMYGSREASIVLRGGLATPARIVNWRLRCESKGAA